MAMAVRSYVAGKIALELDGALAGFVVSAEGGEAFGTVVNEPVGSDGIQHKHIGDVGYDPIVLIVGVGTMDALWTWIGELFAGTHQPKVGALVFLSYDFKERKRLSFTGASITEIVFPTFDAASREHVRVSVSLQPNQTQWASGSGAPFASPVPFQQKHVLASNFRLTIDGADCMRVNRIESLTVKRAAGNGPPHLQIGDLSFTTAESHSQDFRDWHQDFVIDGNNGPQAERSGQIELLSPNLQEVYLKLSLEGLGIYRLGAEKSTGGSETIARLRVQAYCEQIGVELPAAAPVAHEVHVETSEVLIEPASAEPGGEAAISDTTVLAALRRLVLGSPPPLPSPTPSPDVMSVAHRLRGTALRGMRTGGDGPNPASWERGRALGAAWARELATLTELQDMSRVSGPDWTDVSLDAGHSLTGYLKDRGAIAPVATEGLLDMERDDFVEGLVTGALEVYEEVRPHVEGPRSPT
jgi:hypothetical protein